jgi:hypothetical protein
VEKKRKTFSFVLPHGRQLPVPPASGLGSEAKPSATSKGESPFIQPTFMLHMYRCTHIRQNLTVAMAEDQGDQILRIFAQLMIVYFGQALKNINCPHIWVVNFHGEGYALISTKNVSGYTTIGRFFHKLIWSPC